MTTRFEAPALRHRPVRSRLHRPVRTAAYGWTMAGLVFLVFDRLIGLALPVGPWGF